jgi:DNA-binding transcriptional ArsR family regulator
MRKKALAKPVRRSAAGQRAGDDLERVFASVARYFSLLSDPTRLKILHAICQSEQSVTAIVAATGATQTTVSRHLALLHQAGVVSRRRERSLVYYRVADPMFVDICRRVCLQIAGRIDDERMPLRDELLQFAAQH